MCVCCDEKSEMQNKISHGQALTFFFFFILKHDVRYGASNHEQCVRFVSYLKLIKIFVIYC